MQGRVEIGSYAAMDALQGELEPFIASFIKGKKLSKADRTAFKKRMKRVGIAPPAILSIPCWSPGAPPSCPRS